MEAYGPFFLRLAYASVLGDDAKTSIAGKYAQIIPIVALMSWVILSDRRKTCVCCSQADEELQTILTASH
jgi:hypothetical protein